MTGVGAESDVLRGEPALVLGVDSGGSGLRVSLAEAHAGAGVRTVASSSSTEPVRTGASGIDPDHMLGQVVPMARELLAHAAGGAGDPDGSAEAGGSGEDLGEGDGSGAAGQRPATVRAVCVGAAGMASLGDGLRARLPAALAEEFGTRRLALAADTVAAYAGALGERPGAVVAAGTGLMAVGTDLQSWRRADGWGHLLGDCGSGAWIGRAGLEAAMRAYDGRTGGSPALRQRAERVFGEPLGGLPGQLYPRTDRVAVLASFAPEVAACSDEDGVAEGILAAAAREIAATTEAVCPSGGDATVALTGGLLRLGEALRTPLERELTERLPRARTVEAAGDPLEGALSIASRLARDALALPADPALLSVS